MKALAPTAETLGGSSRRRWSTLLTSSTESTTSPVETPPMGVMTIRDRLVTGWRASPKRSRRSMTGITSPRRLSTPSMKEGARGTGVMLPTMMISRTSCRRRE